MPENHHFLGLLNRQYEAPRHGLEQRILAHARTVEQRPACGKHSIWNEVSSAPMQLVYALTLIVGIVMGSTISSPPTPSFYYQTDEGLL